MLRYYLSKMKSINTFDQQRATSRVGFHNMKNDFSTPKANFDQYAAHSPLQTSRFGAEEKRSKIFFQHPPIPNRIPKITMAIFLAFTFCTGFNDKVQRRNRKYNTNDIDMLRKRRGLCLE
jgi:hypothetical protein